MALFINACVRSNSRTKRLADCLINTLKAPVTELRLSECVFPTVDEGFLMTRDELIRRGEVNAPVFDLARQFADADEIIIAAPFWDLSFPTALKAYLEQINVVGITFRYTEEGFPVGLCKARRLYYITTAGGSFLPEEYGFGYVKALSRNFYGISDIELIKAAGLDIYGADTEKILSDCENDIRHRFG